LTAPTSSLSSGLISSRRKSSQQTTSSTSSNITSLHNYYSTKTSSTSSVSSTQTQPKLIIDHSIITANKDKVYQWILNQSKEFKEKYFAKSNELNQLDKTDAKKSSQKVEGSPTNKALQHNNGLDVLDKLKISSYDLDLVLNQNESDMSINEKYFRSLKKINNILHETDISSFEMIHSGLIEKLFSFLNVCDDMSRKFQPINLTPSPTSTKINPSYFIDLNRLVTNESKVLKMKQFLNVFLNLPLVYYTEENNGESQKTKSNFTSKYFSLLVSKLHNCVNQLEQYAVRVHDVPNSIGYGKTAIKFFNTHQIKCLLQRHPSAETALSSSASTKHAVGATSLHSGTSASSSLRQWKGGNVKIDPLAVVGTIEKYLLMRGIHKAPPQVKYEGIFFSYFIYFILFFIFI